ncbi:MAG: outer membrane protein assembly factor BamA [Polyangiaceae bacterium]|nr:outer membrane protein assembly factor BamA [Polyangiaceae bacterium]
MTQAVLHVCVRRWGHTAVACTFILLALATLGASEAQAQNTEPATPNAAAPDTADSAPPPAGDVPPTSGSTDAPPVDTAPGANTDPATPDPNAAIPPSEAELARGLPIARIDVAGNRHVTREDILSYLREQPSDPFDPSRLTSDIRELYNSGFFDDIEVDLTRRDEGVVLRFLVRERPTISSIVFEGNEEIDSEDLVEAIEAKSNSVLSYPALNRSVQKVRDMYAEKGYFLAEVKSSIQAEKDNQVSVKLTVKEHSQVSVRSVTFIGNSAISSEELRAAMFTGNGGFFAFGSGGPFRQDAFERDMMVISGLYYDRGFLTVSVNTPRIMLTPDKSGIEVSVTINEGPRFKIRQLRIYERGPGGGEVEPIGGRRKLAAMVEARSGDYFNRAKLIADLQGVRTLYRDNGFVHVEATPETQLDATTHEVDVVVPIVRGPLVHFERIEIRGNTKTRDRVIRRELEVFEGEPFHETNLEASRRRITALGYFERVDISTEEGSSRDKMNVYIEISEKPTGTFQVGAGFSSVENFILTAQIQQANLFGNGQSFSLQLQASRARTLANASLFEPYFLDSRFNLGLNVFNQESFYQDFSQATRGSALTVGYPLVEPELTASITYTLETDEVSSGGGSSLFGTSSGATTFQQLPLANLFNDGLTSSLRPTLTYDTRDNRLFTTSGVYTKLSTELASDIFGSDNEFLRNTFQGRYFYHVGGGAVLKLNQEFGLVTSPNKEGVPIFARYFLGGITNLRGFQYRSVGPRLPLTQSTDPNSALRSDGARIGGNMLYFQNLEFEFPIVESVGVRGVFFTDAGNTWNIEANYCDTVGGSARFSLQSPCFDGLDSLSRLRTSWGFGLRWFSPLGPLRFEWGFPFKPLPTEESSVFEFTIGNFF